MSTTQKIPGLALAATGAAHFVVPAAFRGISRMAFPKDTDTWIKRNGATELALGLALATERGRKAGAAGLAAYGAFLASRAAANLK